MSDLRRHRLFVLLLWLALAWLPLRGVAQVLMHGPAAGEAAVSAPCHGGHAVDAPTDDAPASSGSSCALCDLCHGAALPPALALPGAGAAPPRVAHVPPLQGRWPPQRLERPPRA
ncbi:MAG: hypothetical protein U1F56_07910 [Rubrivivax sp.]